MKTIPKGTKKFQAAIKTARNIRVFSLENNFHGTELPAECATHQGTCSPQEYLQREIALMRRSKLSQEDNGSFMLSICGNLWYRFEATLPTEDEIRETRNRRNNIARRIKDVTYRSLGMVKVRGALGGTYYE